MSILTLGIIVLVYMFLIAWLGYVGYKQTNSATASLLGCRQPNPVIIALS